MHRLRTFLNGIRSMRPFIGRTVPNFPQYDKSKWLFGYYHDSAPHGHFNCAFIGIGTFKLGTYDTN